MKLLNKVRISLLITLFIIILFNLKAFAVTGTITEITVNMRKEPSTNSKKLMYVTQDYKVEVLEKVGEWYKIKYNGVTGYVYGKYVDVDDSKLEVKEEENKAPEKEEDANQTIEPEETNKNEENVDSNIQDVTTNVAPELQIKEKTDIRLVPNITSSIIYTSKKTKTIDVIEQFGNWSYICVDNISGWVRTENVVEKNTVKPNNSTEDKTKDEEVTITEKTTAYIKYDTVNLRKKASTSSTILAKLKLNNEVIILEKVNSTWTKVEYDGITGYVSSDLLSSEKQKEKSEKEDTTSRDGESVSREEEDKKKEETNKENNSSNVKEESTSNKDKENVSETQKEEPKKEEVKEPVKEDKKETDTETNTDKEEITNELDTKNEDEKDKIEIENKKEEATTSKNEIDTSSKSKGEEIAKYAQKFLGYKYVLGGASPKTGFDCSGLTSYVYKQFGYTLSRTSTQQAKNGKEVSKAELQPGDLLIFKNRELTRIGHVGIYIGNNKMIHASEPGVGVVITDLDARGYNYNKRFVTARRIV